MGNSVTSFSYKSEKEDVIIEAKKIAERERKKFSEFVFDILEEYVKVHKDGNTQFSIDHFQDPDFISCPAFYRDGRTWEKYISNATEEEKLKLKSQIILLDKSLSRYL